MNSLLGRSAIVALLIIFGAFSLFQASWLADTPTGGPKLVASGPVDLPRDARGCTSQGAAGWGAVATSPETRMLQMAAGNEADGINIDSELVGDIAVLPRFFAGKCPSDASRARTPMQAAAAQLTKPDQFISVNDAAHAKAALAALPAHEARIYYGPDAATAALGDNPSFSIPAAQQCASDYGLSGMWGSVPESCQNGTMLLTLGDLGMTLWGWPNRFMARMKEANVRLIVAEDVVDGKMKGLTELSQYNDIARSYNGYIWVDNIEELGPALKR